MDASEFKKNARKIIITQRLESLTDSEMKTTLDGLSQESLLTLEKLFPEAIIFDHLLQLKNTI
jgi:hypothetical protein